MIILYLEVDLVPSNSAYVTTVFGRKSHRSLRPEFALWKEVVTEMIKNQVALSGVTFSPDSILHLEVVVLWERSSLLNKDGSPSRKDLSGHLKLLEDCIPPVLGIDDSYNFKLTLTKQATDKETRVLVKITTLPPTYKECTPNILTTHLT